MKKAKRKKNWILSFTGPSFLDSTGHCCNDEMAVQIFDVGPFFFMFSFKKFAGLFYGLDFEGAISPFSSLFLLKRKSVLPVAEHIFRYNYG